MTIKVAIAGIAGRMGRTLAEMVHGADDLELVGGLERAGSPWLGQSIDAVLGLPAAKGDVLGDIAALPAFDVLLDFTTTQSTLAHLDSLSDPWCHDGDWNHRFYRRRSDED